MMSVNANHNEKMGWEFMKLTYLDSGENCKALHDGLPIFCQSNSFDDTNLNI